MTSKANASFSIKRRAALKSLGLGAAASALSAPLAAQQPPSPFQHGVASGDPLDDRVIIWTRVTPPAGQATPITVTWEILPPEKVAALGAEEKPDAVAQPDTAQDDAAERPIGSQAADQDAGNLEPVGESTPESMGETDVSQAAKVAQPAQRILATGTAQATPARDFTVKVDVTGLTPNQRYRYRFKVGGQVSPIGRTRTLPVGDVKQMTIAACSCSNYPYGFFNVYREMARNKEIDLVLHLGDYIYEYERGKYSSKDIEAAGRTVEPAREIVSLSDYRARYATYRRDIDLQAVHAAHPFLLIWDDHEITNDGWTGGAQNHQPAKEGPWEERRANALKAYDEWMPTRADMRRPWRSYDFGNLARIILLDTRVWGRDKQLDYRKDFVPRTIPFDVTDPDNPKPIQTPNGRATASAKKIERLPVAFDTREDPPKPVLDYETLSTFDPKTAPVYLTYLPDVGLFKDQLESPSRTLLGAEQEAWLGPQLDTSKKRGQTWQILGQQVLMARINIPGNVEDFIGDQPVGNTDQIRAIGRLATYGLPLNMDAWDGYPAARARLFELARQYSRNMVVLAGDTHNAWASELGDAKGKVGYEFGTASVTSPGFEAYLKADPSFIEDSFAASSPNLKWMDIQHRGYLTLTFTTEAVKTQFHAVSTVKSRTYTQSILKDVSVRAGSAPGEAVLDIDET